MTRTIEQLAESFHHVESLFSKQKNAALGHGDIMIGELKKIKSPDFVEVCLELTKEASEASGSYVKLILPSSSFRIAQKAPRDCCRRLALSLARTTT